MGQVKFRVFSIRISVKVKMRDNGNVKLTVIGRVRVSISWSR